MRGSLETFSLPELFKIIESGEKTGKLSFNTRLKNSDSKTKGVFELWFDNGIFIAVVNSIQYQALIAEIQNKNWIDSRLLIRAKYSCPQNLPLCDHLKKEKLLTTSQVDSLFEMQLDLVRQLFNVKKAWFKFEELNSGSYISLNREEFPWLEMTGRRKIASELSLEAMRNFDNWHRFEEDLPPGNSGLQKLTDNLNIQLVNPEIELWNTADGTVSLKDIAKETLIPLEQIQQTALSMILAGLVEEIPVVSSSTPISDIPQFSSRTALVGNSNVAVKPAVKSRVSNSLINNLVGFLRKNF